MKSARLYMFERWFSRRPTHILIKQIHHQLSCGNDFMPPFKAKKKEKTKKRISGM